MPGSTRVEKFHMASNARAVAAMARRAPMILNTELKSKVSSSKFSHNRGVRGEAHCSCKKNAIRDVNDNKTEASRVHPRKLGSVRINGDRLG